MVKLASDGQFIFYGPTAYQHKSEFMNAGLYVVAAVLMLLGFVLLQEKPWLLNPRLGLIFLMVAMLLIVAVNLHELWAHLSVFDFRLSQYINLYSQIVGITVAIVHAIGAVLAFVAFLSMLLQINHSGSVHKSYVSILLIAGPAFWVLGSILNVFQVYNVGNNSQLQMLQKAVYLSFLIGSVLFLINSIVHSHRPSHKVENAWLDIMASAMFVIGGLFNLVKVIKQSVSNMMAVAKDLEHLEDELSREGSQPLLSGDKTAY